MPDIATLAARLTDPDLATRLDAAEQLARSGEASATAAVPLVKACGDADDQVREQAVAALEDLGAPPVEAIADLIPLAAASEPLVAYWAITLLGRSGQAAAAAANAVATLTEQLGSTAAPEVAQRAAWALGKIGPSAAAAADALRVAAGSADPRLARLAGEALALVGG